MIFSLIFILLLISTGFPDNLLLQSVGILFFWVYSLYFFIKQRVELKVNASVVLICIIIPVVSCLTLAMNANYELIFQSIAFMLTGFACLAFVSAKNLNFLYIKLTTAFVVLTGFTLIAEGGALIDSLFLATNDIGSRIRYSPFFAHPNLTGHNFSISFILSSVYCLWHRKNSKIGYFFCFFAAVVSLLIVFATSSRGAIVALFVSGVVFFASRYRFVLAKPKLMTFVLMATAFFGATLFFLASQNANWIVYFSDLLELDSSQRGIDSGLTGRTDNWPIIIKMSLDSVQGILIGNGIRSWNYEIATDSSYVNMLWESGLIILIFTFVFLIEKLKKLFFIERTYLSDLYLLILIFSVSESIVARYLFAIGNPASIIILMIMLTSIKKNKLTI